MWFKNLKIFRLTKHWSNHINDLDAALKADAFAPAEDLSAAATGWVRPRDDDDRFALEVQGQYLLAFRIEKKLLPSTVVNQTVKARAQLLEAEQGYAPGRKQLRDLKENVTDELLPRAFSIARDIAIWIDPMNQWLVIDAAAAAQSDEVLSALGRSLNPYPVEPLKLEHSPTALMTEWLLSGQPPAGFTVDDDSQWQATGEQAASIRYVRHDLPAQTIASHVEDGYQCTRLALTWQDRVSFTLTDTGDLKRVTPLEVLEERAKEALVQTPAEKFDSDFTLMTAELAKLFDELMPVLGEIREKS
ncbi:recombination-associated protein RdgC [Orrella daihaiensis]|uniref:Recombination-associated protein RdgC n=1 Tax=Orrella daihaiensis TaxID=2782176 RepID=A0ABY4AHJ1_9BURK|nr:recombination-associated protein RdgC [Orrella daihaiensis]UOD49756.1 recombination-associated protein RdgC [Orrella daihaiensis]